MKTKTSVEASEVAIFGRIISRENGRISSDLARYILHLGFSKEDTARMHDLAFRNQNGTITTREKDELLGYAKAGCLLGILHSKARQTLKKTKKSSAS